MFSIKSIKHKRARHGEIAATLTVLAMFVLTIGVLFGASLVNQTSPASQTEAFGVSGVTPVESTTGFTVEYTRIDPSRSINPKHAVLYGTICFDENPPLNGRFKIEVYAAKTGDTNRVLAGSSIEHRATSPQTLRCSAGRPASFGAVFTKLPEGFTAENLDKYYVTLHTSNGEFSGIAVDTDIATIAKTAVGSLQSQGSEGTYTPTPSASPSPTQSPTPTTPLPAANKCWAECAKSDSSGNPTSFDSVCGDGLVCKWAGIGTPLPDQERCLDIAAGCKCVPPNVTITDKCNSRSCVCGGLKMCDGRITVSGSVELNDNVPKDSNGNPLRVKVILCQAVTVAGVTQCNPNQTTGNKEIFVTKANPTFSFDRLPQAKYGVYLGQKLVNNNDNSDSTLTVPTDTKVTIDTTTCKSETDPADPQTKKIEASIKDFTSPTSRSQVCYVEVLNGASPSCKAEGIKVKTEIPQPTGTPVPTSTPAPTATPVPSEEDRTITLKLDVGNHTKCTAGSPILCDASSAGKDLSGTWKTEVCAFKNNTEIECKDIETDEFDDLTAGVLSDDWDTHHLWIDDAKYVLPPDANKIKLKNCELKLDGEKDVDCPNTFKNLKSIAKDRKGIPTDDVINYGISILLGSNGQPQFYGQVESNTDRSDVSGNQCINADDYSKLVVSYGKTANEIMFSQGLTHQKLDGSDPFHTVIREDINRDGIVNAFDMAILLTNLNTGEGCAFNQ